MANPKVKSPQMYLKVQVETAFAQSAENRRKILLGALGHAVG